MPLINTNNNFLNQQNGGLKIDARLAEFEDLLKKKRQYERNRNTGTDSVQKGTPVEKSTSTGGMKIGRDFGALDITDASKAAYQKDVLGQDAFNEDGSVKPIKQQQSFNIGDMQEAVEYVNGGIDPKQAKKSRDAKASKDISTILFLESKRQTNPESFTDEDLINLNEAYKSYDVYKMYTDPIYMREAMEESEKRRLEEAPEQPDDYYGVENIKTIPGTSGYNMDPAAALFSNYLQSAHFKDAFSTYVLRSNETLEATSQGKIIRSEELKNLGTEAKAFVEAAEKLYDIDYQLQQYQSKPKLTDEEFAKRQALLLERTEVYRDYSKYKDSCKKFSSWRPEVVETPVVMAKALLGKILGAAEKDLDEINMSIPSQQYFDQIAKLAESSNKSEGGIQAIKNTKKIIDRDLNNFFNNVAEGQKQWQQEASKDRQDIEDWKSGNNWTGRQAEISDYFKYHEQLAQQNGMNPFSAETIMFATPGLQGASNSSWFKTVAGSTAKLVGATAATVGSGGTAALVAGTAGAASFTADYSSGVDENNAEVKDGISTKFDQLLNQRNIREVFLKEGFQKLRNTPEMRNFEAEYIKNSGIRNNKEMSFSSIKNNNLRNEIETFITDQFIERKWESSNPKITKTFAEAIMGSNGYYYRDLLATTRDAAEDAILSCLPIKPAWSAFKATKLGTSTVNAASKLSAPFKAPINWMNRLTARISLFGRGIPSEITQKAWKAKEIVKGVGRFGLGATEMVRSEMQEEAEQQGNTEAFLRGDFNNQLNTSTILRIVEDNLIGIPATFDYFIPGNTFGYASDEEMMANQNGAILLSLPMALITQGPRVYARTSRRINAYDTITELMRAMKAEDMGTIRQNELYAKHANPADKEMILELLDKYRAANEQLGESLKDNDAIRDNDSAIPVEWIDQQRQRFLDFYDYASSPRLRAKAKNLGVKDEDFNTFAAIDYYFYEKQKEAKEAREAAEGKVNNTEIIVPTDKLGNVRSAELNDTQYQIAAQGETAVVTFTKDGRPTTEQKIAELKERDKMLSGLYAAMQAQNDYQSVERADKRTNYLGRNLGKAVTLLKKQVKDRFGLDINSIDDIKQYVIDNNAFDNSINDNRELILAQLNEGMFKKLQLEYNSNPMKFINKYRNAVKSDEELEKAIEEDYYDTLQQYEDAKNREVKNGDVFVGADGKNYKVVLTKDSEGNVVKQKFLYDDEKKTVVGEALPFNPMEYHKAKLAQEKVEAEKREHATRVLDDEELLQPEPTVEVKPQPESTTEPEQKKQVKNDTPLNTPSNDGVEIEFTTKPWRNNKERSNRTARIYLSGKKDKGYFEIVIDRDFETDEENGEYSIHFKPTNGKKTFSNEEKKVLFDALAEMIPEGGIVSTYATKESGITKGGIHGLDRLAKEYGFKKTNQHPTRKTKKGLPVKRVWYIKGTDKTMDGSFYIKGEIKQKPTPQKKEEKAGTADQRKAVEKLRALTEKDNGHLLRDTLGNIVKTGHDYFMKFKNGIVRYVRVHGLDVMDSMFDEGKLDYEHVKNELQELQQTDIEAYKARIIELQNEFNKDLEDLYGKDSDVYKFHCINLEVYTNEDLLEDIGVPDAVASIVTREIPVASVISGTIVDRIARDVFAGETVKYSPEFMMSEDVFKDLIQYLNNTKDHLENELHWVLDTTPHIWHTTLKNGQRVAGETDMIAIDQEGNLHILDFKTTKMQIIEVEQYKNPDYDADEEGSQEWIDVTPYSVIPEDAETRTFNKFTLQKPNGAKRSYGEQYMRQLTAYANIIRQSTDLKVVDLWLVPIYVEKTTDESGRSLVSIDAIEGSSVINLSEIEELKHSAEEVDSALNQSEIEPYTKSSVKQSKLILEEYVDRLNSLKKKKITEDLKKKIDKIITRIDKYGKRLDLLLKDPSKMKDSTIVRLYDHEASVIGNLVSQAEHIVMEQDPTVEEAPARKNRLTLPDNTYQPLFDEEPEGAEVPDEDVEPEDNEIPDDIESEDGGDNDKSQLEHKPKWYEYNNLAGTRGIRQESLLNKIKRLFKFSKKEGDPLSVKPNFINEAKFIIKKKGKGFVVDVLFAGEHFKDLLLNIGIKSLFENRRSELGKKLVAKYKQLEGQLKKGLKIVATSVSRTNGKIVTGKNRPFLASIFANNLEEIQDKLIDGKDSIIGISDGTRVYALTEEQSKSKPSIYSHVGDENDKDITSGTIVYLHRFTYDEDEPGTVRTIPVPLIPKTLHESAIDTIVKILQMGDEGMTANYEATIVDKDGNVSKKQIPGLQNSTVLQLLVRFGGLAEFSGHSFIFDYKRNSYKKPIGGGKLFVISDLRKEKYKNGKHAGEYPQVEIDITNESDVALLKDILSRVHYHCNQEGYLRHNLNGTADSYSLNPYLAFTKFFENDSNNMDIDSEIHITDDLVVSGHDVYTGEQKTRGLSGAAWMMKNGILETNIVGLEEPLISINDIGIENSDGTVTEVEDKKEKTEKKKQPVQEEKEEESETIATETKVEQNEPELSEEEKAKIERRNRLKQAMEMLKGADIPGARKKTVKSVGTQPVNRELVMLRLRKMFGKYIPDVKWLDDVIEKTANGCVVGRMMPGIIELYSAMTPGTEYHEAFHRILDILLPVRILENLQRRFKDRHNEMFKLQHGRDMDERDISEEMADQFMEFKNNNAIVTDKGLKAAFESILSYIKALHNLKDWQLATLYVAVNTGLFRHIKPNQKSIERFKRATDGYRNLTIRNQETGELVQFTEFADYDGRKLYDAAIEGLIHALIVGQDIDDIANNADKLDTSIEAIMKLDLSAGGKKVKDQKMSSWFRVVSGSYIQDGVEFTEQDAVLFYRMYNNTPVMDDIYDSITDGELEQNPTEEDLQMLVLEKIMEVESSKTSPDQLQANQRMMHEMVKHPDILHQLLNAKLSKYQFNSKKVLNDDNHDSIEDNGEPDDFSVYEDSSFYEHSRSESASARVVFFLSVIPDVRFATQEDVDARRVNSTHDDNGNRRTVQNNTNLLGYRQFVPFKVLSNKLLQLCHMCKNPQELDQRLTELGKENAIIATVARRFHRHLENSFARHEDRKDRKIKAYTQTISSDGKNVVITMLDPDKYDVRNDENGRKVVYDIETGQRILNAKVLVNHDEESLVTQLWQYIRCQRLDFTYLSISPAEDENGNAVDGKYKSRTVSTDSDWASTIYPREWFGRFRNPLFGIFKSRHTQDGSKKSRIIFAKGGKRNLHKAIVNITAIRDAFKNNLSIARTIYYDENGEEQIKKLKVSNDFTLIKELFVQELNTLGIGIDVDVFEECICNLFKTGDVEDAMRQLMQSTSKDISVNAFVSDLSHLHKELCEGTPNYNILSENKAASRDVARSSKQYRYASGTFLFSDSAFVKTLALAYSRHVRMTKELMTMGPNHTKRYTMAQCHTASDITEMIKDASVGDDGVTIVGSDLVKDMMQYAYNFMTTIGRITGKRIPIGSRLLKGVLSGANKKLKLCTHGGVKVDKSKTGGQDYKKITAREDYLSKVSILEKGGIIFPTLSDKSTWFYITGCQLAGFDYGNILGVDDSLIPDLVKRDGSIRIEYSDYTQGIDILDLLIEYARCEHEMVRQELLRQKHLSPLQKIANFFTGGNNAVRYASMTEFYTFDESVNEDTGKVEYKAQVHLLSDYGQTPQLLWNDAEKNFFGKDVTDAQRRRSMAMCLQKIVEQNLQQLVQYGLIEKGDAKSGLKGYSNVGLNEDILSKLRSRIAKRNKALGKKYKNEEIRKAAIENDAIIAYVMDICAKSIQSCEETERLYTGMPHFFKWKHKSIKDPITGKEFDCLYDRYDDEIKRHGGLGSTGDQNRIDLANLSSTYRCAECKDPKVQSELLFGYKEGFEDNEFRESYFDMIADSLSTQEEMDTLAEKVFGKDRMSVDQIKKEIKETFTKPVSYDKDGNVTATEGDRIISQIQRKVDSEIESYQGDSIAVADGAAYITPTMAKNLLRQRGCLTEKVELAFSILDGTYEEKRSKLGMFQKYDEKLSSKKPLSNSAAYRIIVDALLGSQKYSAYGYRMAPSTPQDIEEGLGKIPVHYYDKFALFPLFPQIATGFTSDLLAQMEELGIDMLMMDDAVKVGGCDPKRFGYDKDGNRITDKQWLEDFKKSGGFTVYEQNYAFIRRQMNTDPHESEERSIGTQTLKVALNGINKSIDYVVDGVKMKGWQLIGSINEHLNILSDLGEKYFRARFWKDGEFDIDEFSNFLEDQLSSRNADSNLLDGIQVIEKDGKKRLKVPIEAMSSSSWIESILIAAINKEVIDVVSDGNAYYQRSVYGVEEQPISAQLDDGNTLYNGQTLKAINEDGSMDAVISIDYFIHLVPKNIRNNFEKARQFLIDNKVIGPDAEANTIGYRIPTQSQSSIHPLRFVDVLPVVRDTIILPKDFTAITGSDFDIDKLYLASIHYEATYQNVEYTDKDGNKKTKRVQVGVTSKFAKPDELTEEDYRKGNKKYKLTKKYYQNKLVSEYLTALKDRGKIVNGKYIPGNGFHYCYRSVDKDTSLVDDLLENLQRGSVVARWLAWQAGSLAFQVAKKAEFMVGKVGIGPFALNNNSQILTQTFGVKFKKHNTLEGQKVPTILECMKASSLANKQSKRKNRITSWLSALINIHVDVAKDPKPKKLNINSFTYNLTALLTRVGMDDGALLFVDQPIMRELANIHENQSGEFMTDPGKSVSRRIKDAMTEWIEDQYLTSTEKHNMDIRDLIKNRSNGNDAESEYIVGLVLSQLFGLNDSGEYTDTFVIQRPGEDEQTVSGSILLDILTNPEARQNGSADPTFDNLKDSDEYTYVVTIDGQNVNLSPKDVQLWIYFGYKQLDKYAQAMSNLVNTTKIDTKKHGKSFIEQQSYMDQFQEILSEDSSLFEPDGLHALYGYIYKDTEANPELVQYEPSNDSKTHDYEITTFIGRKTMNAINLTRDVISQFSLQATEAFIDAHRRLLDMIGGSVRNTDLCKKVSTAMMLYIKSRFFFVEEGGWLYREGISPKAILIGNSSVQDKLISIQNAIKADKDGKYSKYVGNKLIFALSADIYEEEEGEENYRFIKLDNSFLDELDDINDVEQAWDEMLHDDKTEFQIGEDEDGNPIIITMDRFAKELIAYAFITSADTNGMTKFFKYVPNSWRIDSGYADYMHDVQQNGYVFEDDELEEIIRNNWLDKDFVRELPQGEKFAKVIRNPGFVNKKRIKSKPNIPWIIGCIRTYTRKKTNQQITQSTVHKLYTTDQFPMFIRRRRPGAKDYSSDSYLLYKLIYVGQKYLGKDSEGKDIVIDYPIYALTYPKGKVYKAGSYSYEINQYCDTTVYQQAYASRYNTPGNVLTQEAIDSLLEYIDNMPSGLVDLTDLVDNTDEMFEKKQVLRSAIEALEFDGMITKELKSAISKALSKLAEQEKQEKLKEQEKVSDDEQNDDNPLGFDEAPEGTEDNEFDNEDEFPSASKKHCKGE